MNCTASRPHCGKLPNGFRIANFKLRHYPKLRAEGIEGPWAIFASIVNVKDYSLVPNSRSAWVNIARLSELIIDEIDASNLLPIAKSFWLIFGEERPWDRPFGNLQF